MNKEDKANIQEIIDRIYATCNTGSVLIANNEYHAKKLRELFPGIKVIVRPSTTINSIGSADTVYIISAEEKSIKVIYEGGSNENQQ